MLKNMSKKTIIVIIAVVLLIGLASYGYVYLNSQKKSENAPVTSALKNAEETVDEITEGATKGVLPSLETNPLEDKPDVNPASKANPIKDIKTNPFE